MPPPVVEFFFDCSSPWTYLAFHNIQPLAERHGFAIDWRPFVVGGVFNTVNPSVYEFRRDPIPAKDAYIGKDLADWARLAGLRILWRPSIFPISSVRAMRACLVAKRAGRLVAFARAVFELYWRDDRDIRLDAVLARACAAADLPAAELLAAIETQAVKDELRAATDELVARGGFGAPTFFVGGTDMYFGNDRLPLVAAAATRLAQAAS